MRCKICQIVVPLVYCMSSAYAVIGMQNVRRADIISAHLRGKDQYSTELRNLTAEQRVEGVIELLQNDPAYQQGVSREIAYKLLIKENGAVNPAGVRQLIICLQEATLRGLCGTALRNVPQQFSKEVIDALGRSLETIKDQSDLDTMIPILRALGSFGNHAGSQLANVEKVFDNGAYPVPVRLTAASTMFRIGGAGTLPKLQSDPDAEKYHWPLAALTSQADDTLALDEPSRQSLQKIVLKMMRSDDKQTREDGFEFLLLAYRGDFLIESPEGKFGANPEFKEAIVYMAQHETDELLRQRAQGVLDTLDQRVKNAIRRRENPDKYKPGVP